MFPQEQKMKKDGLNSMGLPQIALTSVDSIDTFATKNSNNFRLRERRRKDPKPGAMGFGASESGGWLDAGGRPSQRKKGSTLNTRRGSEAVHTDAMARKMRLFGQMEGQRDVDALESNSVLS